MIPIANPQIGSEELERVEAVLESGMLADGPEVRSFEEEFADYCDTHYAVATTNGTAALHAAFEALELGQDDRVLTTPFSFISSSNAIRLTGAEPVFADIDPQTYNLDPEAARMVLEEEQIDAILVVHLYGLPADIGTFVDLAEEYDLALIEDAAQAHGAEYDGRPVGSIGDVGCFSFYPTKNMTTGEGGIITTDDEDIANRAASYVNHGRPQGDDPHGYDHLRLGHNYRMTSLAAVIGRAQLERLPEYVESRQRNAARLTEALEDVPVRTPVVPDDRSHAYHQYTIELPERERAIEVFDEHDVGCGIYYPTTIPDQPAYDDHPREPSVPNARRAADRVLSIPVHPSVDREDIATIARAVRDATKVVVDE